MPGLTQKRGVCAGTPPRSTFRVPLQAGSCARVSASGHLCPCGVVTGYIGDADGARTRFRLNGARIAQPGVCASWSDRRYSRDTGNSDGLTGSSHRCARPAIPRSGHFVTLSATHSLSGHSETARAVTSPRRITAYHGKTVRYSRYTRSTGRQTVWRRRGSCASAEYLSSPRDKHRRACRVAKSHLRNPQLAHCPLWQAQ